MSLFGNTESGNVTILIVTNQDLKVLFENAESGKVTSGLAWGSMT